jgi:hypothetical protein
MAPPEPPSSSVAASPSRPLAPHRESPTRRPGEWICLLCSLPNYAPAAKSSAPRPSSIANGIWRDVPPSNLTLAKELTAGLKWSFLMRVLFFGYCVQ